MMSQRHVPADLNPQERPGTHCTRGRVSTSSGLIRLRKISPPTGIRSPDRPARSQSVYRLSYRGPPSGWSSLKIKLDEEDFRTAAAATAAATAKAAAAAAAASNGGRGILIYH